MEAWPSQDFMTLGSTRDSSRCTAVVWRRLWVERRLGEAGAERGRRGEVFLDDGPYAEAGEGAAALIDEETVGGGG